jgi:hypothetical protein
VDYPGQVKGNISAQLEELSKTGYFITKRAIELLLQKKRLNKKSGQK